MNYTRWAIALLLFLPLNAVAFGLALVVVMITPPLAAQAIILIPVIVVASFPLALAAAWWMAPRLRLRYWKRRGKRPRVAFA